jgi:activating signal cointegrator 1
MKALTLTQPWATLVVIGAKQVETRSWSRDFEDVLAIHAAKGYPRDCQTLIYRAPFEEALRKGGYPKHQAITHPLPLGCIVATCRVARVLPITSFATIKIQAREYCGIELTDAEEAFGDYSAGRFAWILADVKPFEPPFHVRGMLGLWEWNR